MHVELCDGLQKITERAFLNCKSLVRIRVPSSVKVIGQKEIMSNAFHGCTSLVRLNVPASVRTIRPGAFTSCPYLAVEFCTEIQDLVTELSITEWYAQGMDGRWLFMYTFLVDGSILKRLGRISSMKWREDILDLLRRFPSISCDKILLYCKLISGRLDCYSDLKDAASLLELALWTSKILEQHADVSSANNLRDAMKKTEHRMNCGATVIIPNVLSFLLPTFDVVEDSDEDEENSEDEESDEDMPFHPWMFGGFFGMFVHHMFHAHHLQSESEGSSEED